jgi:hypothetical protein
VPKCLWMAILPFFLGCAKDHHIPPAELGYLGVSRKSENLYEVRFLSDTDLLNVFKSEDSPVGGMLRCSLVGDDMPNEHSSERYVAKGLVTTINPVSSAMPFGFKSSIMFVESLNDGRSFRALRGLELQEILSARQSVPCVYWATAYGFKTYHSGVLQVPVADVLRELGK